MTFTLTQYNGFHGFTPKRHEQINRETVKKKTKANQKVIDDALNWAILIQGLRR